MNKVELHEQSEKSLNKMKVDKIKEMASSLLGIKVGKKNKAKLIEEILHKISLMNTEIAKTHPNSHAPTPVTKEAPKPKHFKGVNPITRKAV